METTKIEGRDVVVVRRQPPLPRRLDTLLSLIYQVSVREDIRPAGATASCEVLRTHRFAVLREGRYLGPDQIVRDLRVTMCRDCGAACVRDVSVDSLDGLPSGRGGPARRDLILGWYSGARRGQRQYA